ncbi:hypothetical protein M440DRAFT_1433858 [Trichoderma longibrachiatum ATCC 18648]|uniref:Protein kinase domain-containing protein n=1 Tax=Trichoderma longibrachiatum ATCC 18648 TaxID=983965 RepID=A0A2T4BSJ7_TRILO|nr:hypothetical protein M440DRAFT_1433858 [Trichoderma longibrachiatum ATCC 18648]
MDDTNAPDSPSSIVHARSPMPFVVFAGANAAAKHLLELIRVTTSSPTLETSGQQARYAITVPVWPTEKGSSILKWTIGSGVPPTPAGNDLSAASTAPPDILLCPPGASDSASSARQDISPLHAALYFHPRSGGLVFENRSGSLIVYEGGDRNGQDVTLTKHTTMQTVLWKQDNYLQFGEHRFVVSFVAKSSDEAYIGQQFDDIIGCLYDSLAPSTLFNFAPRPDAKLQWYIAIHKLFPSGRLTAGTDVRTGQPLAVKRVSKIDMLARRQIVTRLQVMYRTDIGPQEGIMKALDVWCEVGRLSHNLHHEQGGPCRCQWIEYSMPIAEHSFQDMPWQQVKADDRIRYFRQTLIGLAKLHESGIAHGHITPTSLLLLTEEGREMPTCDEYSVKELKAILSLCMPSTEVRTPNLCMAPELVQELIQQCASRMAYSGTVAQDTDGNEAVGAAAHSDASVTVEDFNDQEMEPLQASLDNTAAPVPEALSNDAAGLAHWNSSDAAVALMDMFDGAEWKPADDTQALDGTEADVWALAMSWLSTLIALPAPSLITEEIHSSLLDDLDAKTNSSVSTNEKIMALIIRDMLCWDPRARPSAEVALQHAAWSVIKMRLANEEDKKRKRGGIDQQGNQSELREDKRARVVSLDE